MLAFTFLLMANVHGTLGVASQWNWESFHYTLLQIVGRASNVLFLALVVVTTLTRLSPVRKAAGIEPRLSALLGTFLLFTLVLLPRRELPPTALAISSVFVIVGLASSFVVLRWLGKSFSIMAEARRLV